MKFFLSNKYKTARSESKKLNIIRESQFQIQKLSELTKKLWSGKLIKRRMKGTKKLSCLHGQMEGRNWQGIQVAHQCKWTFKLKKLKKDALRDIKLNL